ncbi:MAG: helix-turn-helix transcriptional regulator [Saprospiraceae bacterium]|jgi:DNA-binding HxlR family transcriptional regulator|nr:helix-turn-helix transcriptional regulator [Saprospiraceae bacterium]
MKENSAEKCIHESCPVRNVLARFGDKWSLLVIQLLGRAGTMRFNELHKAIDDISQKMLTVTLRTLETDGLVSRTVFPEVPPRVEYAITPLGESLIPHIEGLTRWAHENMGEIMKRRVGEGQELAGGC